MNEEPTPRRSPTSLANRLVAAALIWLVLLLALGGVVLGMAFRDTVEEEFGRRLDALTRAMIAATEIGPDGQVTVVRPLGDPRFDQIFSGWYWQVSDPSGRLVRSRSLWDSTIPVHPDAGTVQRRRIQGPKGEPLLIVERDLDFPGASGSVHVLIAGDLRGEAAEVRRFDTLLIVALGLLGAGMAVAVFLQVRFGLRPLRAMKADLDAVREGQRPRLAGEYPGEIAPLADAMNRVLDNDAVLIDRARTHVGNLAHGLKTPLAVLQAEMAGVPDRRVVVDQIKIMARLIEHHLGRAAAVSGAGRALGVRVAVRSLATEIAAALGRIYADKHLIIDVRIPERATFRGQREDMEEMLGNLMENACKWARSQVVVSAELSAGGLLLAVDDDGQGISPEQAEAVSQRGVRLDENVPGWGLGLAIVSDLASVNGGKLGFERSALGGLRVSVSLPAKPALQTPASHYQT